VQDILSADEIFTPFADCHQPMPFQRKATGTHGVDIGSEREGVAVGKEVPFVSANRAVTWESSERVAQHPICVAQRSGVWLERPRSSQVHGLTPSSDGSELPAHRRSAPDGNPGGATRQKPPEMIKDDQGWPEENVQLRAAIA
jgi:hypothetical protein